MEHDKLSRLLPDGLDEGEADALDATWRMLGAVDSPAPNSDRMRARLDVVIDAVEHAPTSMPPRRWQPSVLQCLAAAAMLVIGAGIGWLAGSQRARPVVAVSTAQIDAMRSEMHDLREMVSLSLMQQQSASERLKGV